MSVVSPIKLIACDLDGTLVNHQLEISPRVKQVLGYLIEETDIRVVLATGRMMPSARPFAEWLGIQDPIISYQGGMVSRMDKANSIVAHFPIEPDLAIQVLDLLETRPCHVNVYVENILYTKPHPTFVEEYAQLSGFYPQVVDDLRTVIQGSIGVTKMLAIHHSEPETTETIAQLQANYPLEVINSCKSRHNFCEVIHPTTSKWVALKILADEWGIRPEEIMVIGDHGNDLPMIEHAGIGVAMGNAPEWVKAKADAVVAHLDDDGAVEAIERFVFGGTLPAALQARAPKPEGKPVFQPLNPDANPPVTPPNTLNAALASV